MKLRLFSTAAIASALVAAWVQPVSAQQDNTIRLSPSMPWNLDMAEQSCALRRMFGEEGREVYLELRQYTPDGWLQMSVLADGIHRRTRSAQITFLPDDNPTEFENWFHVEDGDFGEGLLVSVDLMRSNGLATTFATEDEKTIPPVSDEDRDARESEIQGVRIEGAFRRPIELQTGQMHGAMSAMRTCMDQLVGHWGIDVEAHRNLSRAVEPRNRDVWADEISSHYPSSMQRRGEQAYIHVRMNVSTAGSPTACVVQSQLNDAEFDSLACELLMEHSRFTPALDANGQPIASYWATSIIYTLS